MIVIEVTIDGGTAFEAHEVTVETPLNSGVKKNLAKVLPLVDYREATFAGMVKKGLGEDNMDRKMFKGMMERLLNEVDIVSRGGKVYMSHSNTLQSLGMLGCWGKQEKFDTDRYFKMVAAYARNPEHRAELEEIQGASSVLQTRADVEPEAEPAANGGKTVPADTRTAAMTPTGLDEFILLSAPPRSWLKECSIDPKVSAPLSAEEKETCMAFLHTRAGTHESKGWRPVQIAKFAFQCLYEAILERLKEQQKDMAGEGGMAAKGGSFGSDQKAEDKASTKVRNSAKRYTAFIVDAMMATLKRDEAVAGAMHLVKHQYLQGDRFILHIVETLSKHEAVHLYELRAIKEEAAKAVGDAVASMEAVFKDIHEREADHLWSHEEVATFETAVQGFLHKARKYHGIDAGARAELGIEWGPEKVIEKAAKAILHGHMGGMSKPRWNHSTLGPILREKTRLSGFVRMIIAETQSRLAEVKAADKRRAESAKTEKRAAEVKAAALAKAKADDEARQVKAIADMEADLNAKKEATMVEAKMAKLGLPSLGAPLLLRCLIEHPWTMKPNAAPAWTQMSERQIGEVVEGPIFDLGKVRDMDAATLFGVMRVVNAITQSAVDAAEEEDPEEELSGASWTSILFACLCEKYGLSATDANTNLGVRSNVTKAVEEDRQRFTDTTRVAAQTSFNIVNDTTLVSKGREKLAMFKKSNGEMSGHSLMPRWEQAMMQADVLERVSTAEAPADQEVTADEGAEWSMTLSSKDFVEVMTSKRRLREHFSSRLTKRPSIARLAYTGECDAIIHASDDELDARMLHVQQASRVSPMDPDTEMAEELAEESFRRFERRFKEWEVPRLPESFPEMMRDDKSAAGLRRQCVAHAMEAVRSSPMIKASELIQRVKSFAAGELKRQDAAFKCEALVKACMEVTAMTAKNRTPSLQAVIAMKNCFEKAMQISKPGKFTQDTAMVYFEKVWGQQTRTMSPEVAAEAAIETLAWDFVIQNKSTHDFPVGSALGKLVNVAATAKGHGMIDEDGKRLPTIVCVVERILKEELEVDRKTFSAESEAILDKVTACKKNEQGAYVMPTGHSRMVTLVRDEQIEIMQMMIGDPEAFVNNIKAQWATILQQKKADAEAVDAGEAGIETVGQTPPEAPTNVGLLNTAFGLDDQHPALQPLLQLIQVSGEGSLASRLQALPADPTHDIQGEQLIGEASGLRPAPMEGVMRAVNAGADVRMQRIDTREHRLRLKSTGTKKESVTEVIRHADVEPSVSSVVFVGQEMIIVAQPVVQDHEAKWKGDRERIATLAQSPGKKRAWKMRKYTQGGFFEQTTTGTADSRDSSTMSVTEVVNQVAAAVSAMTVRLGHLALPGGETSKEHDIKIWTVTIGGAASTMDEDDCDGRADMESEEDSPAGDDGGGGRRGSDGSISAPRPDMVTFTPAKERRSRMSERHDESKHSADTPPPLPGKRDMYPRSSPSPASKRKQSMIPSDGRWELLHGSCLATAGDVLRFEMTAAARANSADSENILEKIGLFCDNAPAEAIACVMAHFTIGARCKSELAKQGDKATQLVRDNVGRLVAVMNLLARHEWDWATMIATNSEEVHTNILQRFATEDKRNEVASSAIDAVLDAVGREITNQTPVRQELVKMVSDWMAEREEDWSRPPTLNSARAEILRRRAETIILCGGNGNLLVTIEVSKELCNELKGRGDGGLVAVSEECGKQLSFFDRDIQTNILEFERGDDVLLATNEVKQMQQKLEAAKAVVASIFSDSSSKTEAEQQVAALEVTIPISLARKTSVTTLVEKQVFHTQLLRESDVFIRILIESGAILDAKISAKIIALVVSEHMELIQRLFSVSGWSTSANLAAELRRLVSTTMLEAEREGLMGEGASETMRGRWRSMGGPAWEGGGIASAATKKKAGGAHKRGKGPPDAPHKQPEW